MTKKVAAISKDTEFGEYGNKGVGGLPMIDEENEGLESTLGMLRDFVYGRIKYKDFNDYDKTNLVEIFVTHPTSLLKFYECIFP